MSSAELIMGEESGCVCWCLFGEPGIVEGLRGERAGAVVEHELREVARGGGGLGGQAAKHCV